MTQQQINEEMLKELRQIRQLLERITQPQAPPQPTTAKLTNLTGYVMGRADAPLTLVEFTDLQCPFCRQYATSTFDQIKKNWIDTGKLRYISRDYPLDFHPQAMRAARAARCAGDQGKFWEYHRNLMLVAGDFSDDDLKKRASTLGLDGAKLGECLASGRFDAVVNESALAARSVGVNSTPTFFLHGRMLTGAVPAEELARVVDDELKRSGG